jgi:hypothetical protein
MVDWVISCRVKELCYGGGADSKGELTLVLVLKNQSPLKPQAILYVMCARVVEGGGLLAGGQTWCSQKHLRIRRDQVSLLGVAGH